VVRESHSCIMWCVSDVRMKVMEVMFVRMWYVIDVQVKVMQVMFVRPVIGSSWVEGRCFSEVMVGGMPMCS
jgi:hypothetical protein